MFAGFWFLPLVCKVTLRIWLAIITTSLTLDGLLWTSKSSELSLPLNQVFPTWLCNLMPFPADQILPTMTGVFLYEVASGQQENKNGEDVFRSKKRDLKQTTCKFRYQYQHPTEHHKRLCFSADFRIGPLELSELWTRPALKILFIHHLQLCIYLQFKFSLI